MILPWPAASLTRPWLPGEQGLPPHPQSWQGPSSPNITSTPELRASVSQTSEEQHKVYESTTLKCGQRGLYRDIYCLTVIQTRAIRNVLEPAPRGGATQQI